MKCLNCGTEIQEDAQVCPSCKANILLRKTPSSYYLKDYLPFAMDPKKVYTIILFYSLGFTVLAALYLILAFVVGAAAMLS